MLRYSSAIKKMKKPINKFLYSGRVTKTGRHVCQDNPETQTEKAQKIAPSLRQRNSKTS